MIIENPKINPYNYNNLFLTKIFLKCTGEKKTAFSTNGNGKTRYIPAEE